MNDLKFAIRRLVKSPGYTSLAVLTLALGIGACTAVFSVVNAVLLRPLPYPDPERLILLRESSTSFPAGAVSFPNFHDWRESQHGFTDLALFRGERLNFSVPGNTRLDPERILVARVAGSFLNIVGLPPQLGRYFTADEDAAGGPRAVVLSDRLWRRAFGGSPDAVGRSVMVDGISRTVVGIADPRVKIPRQAELYVPLGELRGQQNTLNRGAHGGYSVLARLRTDTTLAAATAELNSIAAGLEQKYPETNTGRRVRAQALYENAASQYRLSLLLLLGAVGCVLLIACANIAGLQLARAAGRVRELAVRAALGASRGQLARQFLLESLVLAVVGGGAGILFAWWGLSAIQLLNPPNAPRFAEAQLDWQVLAFNGAIALTAGILVGLWPAWRASLMHNLAGRIQEGGTRGGSDGPGRGRAHSGLVVAQVALALILLTGAGLLIRSFQRVQDLPLGFSPTGILMLELQLPRVRYDSDEKVNAFYAQLLQRVSALPGVRGAAIGANVPFDDTSNDASFHVTNTPDPGAGKDPQTEVSMVSNDYFRVLGIDLLRGRVFDASDTTMSPKSVLIDETFAAKHFAGKDPIGMQIDDNQADGKDAPPLTVVGVVRRPRNDAPGDGIESLMLPQMYFSHAQYPESDTALLVRTDTDNPQTLAAAVAREIHAIDPEQAVVVSGRMDQLIATSLAPRRLTMSLLGVFSGIALLLAIIGLYGLLALSVAQRTREFGIRMALGAQAGAVRTLVVRRGLALVGIGLVAGFVGAMLLGRVMSSLLFAISPFDPPTLLSVFAILGLSAVSACLVPAWRATRVDPAIALRAD
jgi:putative ABC transport system permease protein